MGTIPKPPPRTSHLPSPFPREDLTADVKQRVVRALCTNDTFGRIAYSLGLHRKAALTASEKADIDAWDPHSPGRPPKVLADLFEAYVGALYHERGMPAVKKWLDRLFDSLDSAASKDLASELRTAPETPSGSRTRGGNCWVTQEEIELLEDFIWEKRDDLRRRCSGFLDSLPKDFFIVTNKTPDSLRLELGDALLKLFIANQIVLQWPWYFHALNGAPHTATVSSPPTLFTFTSR